MLELLLIVLLIFWLFGGLALPSGMSLLNIILFIVLVYVLLKIAGKVK